MKPGRTTPTVLAAALLVAGATTLPAQSVASGAVALGFDRGTVGTPIMAGVDFTWYHLPMPFLAARGGVDLSLGNVNGGDIPFTVETTGFRAWSVDADLLLAPNHSALPAAPLGALDPVLFAGLGLRNAVDSVGSVGAVLTASFGGGVSYWLHPNIRIDAEARRWHVLSDRALMDGFESDGWAFRAGVAFHLAPRFHGDATLAPRVDTVWLRPEGGQDEPGGVDTPEAGGEAPWRTMNVPATRRAVLEDAEQYLGTPYVWGGAEPVPGFDCSGFVQYVFEAEGIQLPRPSRVMAQVGAELPAVVDSLLPGDVMFFSETGSPDNITHVGIYAGDETILHATGSGGGVSYDDLTTPRGRWFADRLVAATRVIGVPIAVSRAKTVFTPETWDPATDGAPPREGVQPPGGDGPGG